MFVMCLLNTGIHKFVMCLLHTNMGLLCVFSTLIWVCVMSTSHQCRFVMCLHHTDIVFFMSSLHSYIYMLNMSSSHGQKFVMHLHYTDIGLLCIFFTLI